MYSSFAEIHSSFWGMIRFFFFENICLTNSSGMRLVSRAFCYMDESWYTCKWVMSHRWMSHVTHMNESCHTYEWVMSHIWMSHVTHIYASLLHEWVLSLEWVSHARIVWRECRALLRKCTAIFWKCMALLRKYMALLRTLTLSNNGGMRRSCAHKFSEIVFQSTSRTMAACVSSVVRT